MVLLHILPGWCLLSAKSYDNAATAAVPLLDATRRAVPQLAAARECGGGIMQRATVRLRATSGALIESQSARYDVPSRLPATR